MTISVSFLEKQKQQRVEANDIIKRDTLYAAGLGLVPVPIVDVLSIATIQIWMIRDIAKIYNIPFKRHMVKSFIGSLIGNTGAISLVKSYSYLCTWATLYGTFLSRRNAFRF